VGFYYGSSKPPEDEPGTGGFRDVVAITWAVFRVLSIPVGILLGTIFYLVLVFWLFSIHPLAGLAAILAALGAFGARAVWEAKHPPDLG
jgi:hypothetical protein